MTAITAPGVYAMPAEQYHADPCPSPSLSASGAHKLLRTCPARYWHDRQHPPEPSDAMNVGSAAHEWLLEGDAWPQRFVVLPHDHDGRSRAGRERVDAILAAGKRPLKAGDFDTIRGMRDALLAHDFAGSAFANGRAEQSLFWRDEATGIWCRARPDWLPNAGTIVADYKTTRSASLDDLPRAIAEYGYDVQAAHYMDGCRVLGLIERPSFLFVFQEREPPYLVTPVVLSEAALAVGEMKIRRARALFRDCLRSGRWPGYTDDVVTVDLPPWEMKRVEADVNAGLYAISDAAQAPLTPEYMA